MMLQVVALLCVLSLSTALGQVNWYAGTHINAIKLMDMGCYRGTYRGSLSLSTCNTLDARLQFVGRLSQEARLCVVEARSQSALEQAKEFIKHVANPNSTKIIFQTNAQLVLASLTGSVLELCAEDVYPAGLINDVISVPFSTWLSPHPAMVDTSMTGALVNPTISHALENVQRDNMYQSLEHLTSYYTRHSFSPLAVEAGNWLFAQYSAMGFQVKTFSYDSNYAPAIIAEWPAQGDFADQVVLVGAHFDSRAQPVSDSTVRAPGADDNGSGTAAMLEIARVISSLKLQFQYTLRICGWTGEEQGLVGSRAYAATQAAQGAKLVLYILLLPVIIFQPGFLISLCCKASYNPNNSLTTLISFTGGCVQRRHARVHVAWPSDHFRNERPFCFSLAAVCHQQHYQSVPSKLAYCRVPIMLLGPSELHRKRLCSSRLFRTPWQRLQLPRIPHVQ